MLILSSFSPHDRNQNLTPRISIISNPFKLKDEKKIPLVPLQTNIKSGKVSTIIFCRDLIHCNIYLLS